MFNEEEINSMQVLKRGRYYIEVRCGCTSQKYGDYIGKLKITTKGRFVIDCECFDGCPEKKMTPYDFEKHSQRDGPRKWKDHIWVSLNDEKVPLSKTCLITTNLDTMRPLPAAAVSGFSTMTNSSPAHPVRRIAASASEPRRTA
ncbi:hypothetical protein Q3G72_014798 [Acer saccharum]|nr:hypothetical protein Q3G72_014798 [Acer saccharum]